MEAERERKREGGRETEIKRRAVKNSESTVLILP